MDEADVEAVVGVGDVLTYREATETQPSLRAAGEDAVAALESSRDPKRTRCAEAMLVANAKQVAHTIKRRQ